MSYPLIEKNIMPVVACNRDSELSACLTEGRPHTPIHFCNVGEPRMALTQLVDFEIRTDAWGKLAYFYLPSAVNNYVRH
jgi:hypothetical protein